MNHRARQSLSLLPLLALVACGSNQRAEYPSSAKSYEDAEAEVGCASPFSDSKKQEIWQRDYEDHWLTWTGTVKDSTRSTANIDVNGNATDLIVDFEDGSSGHELAKGDTITVRFVPTKIGGCFVTPYEGAHAALVDSTLAAAASSEGSVPIELQGQWATDMWSCTQPYGFHIRPGQVQMADMRAKVARVEKKSSGAYDLYLTIGAAAAAGVTDKASFTLTPDQKLEVQMTEGGESTSYIRCP